MPPAIEVPRLTAKDVQNMYIANCVCCLLAEAMKHCATCPFNVGLEARAKAFAQPQTVKGMPNAQN